MSIRFAVLGLAILLSGASALTFTSPTPGQPLDPTQSIVIKWTSDGSDPSNIDLIVSSANSGSVFPEQTLATGVSTASGQYVVPANTIQSYGTGFQIDASGAGTTVGQVTGLTLGAGSNQVSTASNGQVSFVGESTANVPAATGTATLTGIITSAPGSGASSAAGSVTILTGTVTGSAAVSSSTGSSDSTSRSSSFITSSTSRSSSEASAAATTSAANSNTANSQGRVASEVVLCGAGVLAGIVALLA